MNKTLILPLPCTPSIQIELEEVKGKRKLVVINTNGGMAGGSIAVVGKVARLKDGLYQIHLSESNRTMTVNPSCLNRMESATLWKQVHFHNNPNWPSPRITYFYGLGDVKFTQTNVYGNRPPKSEIWSEIKETNC